MLRSIIVLLSIDLSISEPYIGDPTKPSLMTNIPMYDQGGSELGSKWYDPKFVSRNKLKNKFTRRFSSYVGDYYFCDLDCITILTAVFHLLYWWLNLILFIAYCLHLHK